MAPRLDAAFPGGNIVVERVEGDNVWMHQDLRDTAGDWFYWCFRVSGAQGRTLTFHFTKGCPIGVCGPAVSSDGGRSWQWLGNAAVQRDGFRYTFASDAGDVRFGVAWPYTEANLQALVARVGAGPHLRVETLCRTTAGRTAERLRVGRLDGGCAHRVLLTCRHHCCESMASFVIEGVIEAVLADTAEGGWLREQVEFLIVPFVDKDGVEAGDQGKNRKPRDHNRDYAGNSLYPTVRAIREQVPGWADGRLRFALDLHCPTLRGGRNEETHFVGGPDEAIWREVGRFSRLLEAHQTGPIVFRASHNLSFGRDWNTPANYAGGESFARWAAGVPGVRAAATLEVPYARAGGAPVTDQSARALGRDLARALQAYLAAAP